MNPHAKNAMEFGRAIALGGLICTVLYWMIASFEGSIFRQHQRVADGLILLASLLLLPVIWREEVRHAARLAQWRYWALAWAVLVVASVLSPDVVRALARLQLYYAVFLFSVAVRSYLPRDDTALQVLTKTVLLGVGVVHVAILLLVGMAWQRAESAVADTMSWIPYHSNIRHIAYHGMVAASGGLVLGLWGGRLRLLGYTLAVVSLTGLIYFGSRGAVIGCLIAGLCAALLFRRVGMGVLAMLGVMALSIFFSAELGVLWKPSPFDGDAFQRLGAAESVVGSDGRWGLWKGAFVAIAAHPLLGYGPDAYVISRCCPSAYVQVHNALLQVALEFGLAGVLVIGGLLWASLRSPLCALAQAWRTVGIPGGAAAVSSVLIGVGAYSMVDGLVYHAVPLFLVAVLFVLFAAQSDRLSGAAFEIPALGKR